MINSIMATPININEGLIQEAMSFNDSTTAIEDVVEIALYEYIQRCKRLKMLELFGMIEYDEAYDYKQQRQSA